MPNPDRAAIDQEPVDSGSTKSDSAESAAREPQPGQEEDGAARKRTRVRVKPPTGPAAQRPAPQALPPTPPSFVLKAGSADGEGDGGPRIDSELGLGWLQPSGPAGTETPEPASAVPPGGRRVRPPGRLAQKLQADLSGRQQVQGQHVGDRYVRIVRQQSDDFQRAGPGYLVATEEAMEATGTVGRAVSKVKRTLIGHPLTTASAAHERLTKLKALAVLSSDALSSVAYATEEILRVLLVASGLAILDVSLPIGAAIIALLVIVGVSYRQTIKAYPHGGGSYIVAKDNLGPWPALTAGAALLTDYVLTVAVSIAAAVAAIVSAFPELHDHRVGLGLFFVLIVTVLNLRGIRESGSIFAVPTYLFLLGIFALLAIGLVRNAGEGFAVHDPPAEAAAATSAVGLFLILRAFSSGCAALTGVEAISDGVPAFQPPEWKNARATLSWMIGILAVTFSGITFLAHQYGALPMEAANPNYQTVVSQIARSVLWGE